jgi:HigB_toxin, RelE-like toxic component of a toxin-antitoxin system
VQLPCRASFEARPTSSGERLRMTSQNKRCSHNTVILTRVRGCPSSSRWIDRQAGVQLAMTVITCSTLARSNVRSGGGRDARGGEAREQVDRSAEHAHRGGGRRDRACAGGNYRLVAAFDFRRQVAFVKFIGTHAEYDRIDASTVAQF